MRCLSVFTAHTVSVCVHVFCMFSLRITESVVIIRSFSHTNINNAGGPDGCLALSPDESLETDGYVMKSSCESLFMKDVMS